MRIFVFYPDLERCRIRTITAEIPRGRGRGGGDIKRRRQKENSFIHKAILGRLPDYLCVFIMQKRVVKSSLRPQDFLKWGKKGFFGLCIL